MLVFRFMSAVVVVGVLLEVRGMGGKRGDEVLVGWGVGIVVEVVADVAVAGLGAEVVGGCGDCWLRV